MPLLKDKPVVKQVVEEFVPFDPWRPVLKNSPSLHSTDEQNAYIKEILEICCSDSLFAKKAYAALQYILTGVPAEAPSVTSLSPATAVIGDPVFDLHVIGTGFTAESIITFNGIDEPTTLVSPTELTTGVNMPLWTAPAVVPVAVKNGDLTSEAVNFEFTAPALLSTPSVKSKDEGYKGEKNQLGHELSKQVEEHKGQEKK